MKFIKYILFVLVGTIILDVLFRVCISTFYSNPSDFSRISTMYKFAYQHEKARIIILGASRAENSYKTLQIEDSLHELTYNYGMAGQSIVYQYLDLERAFLNDSVVFVILDLSPKQLSKNWIEGHISQLYPFYWTTSDVRTIVKKIKGCKMDLLMCSAFIQFNSSFDDITGELKHEKGYIPNLYTGELPGIVNDNDIVDANYYSVYGEQYFSKIVEKCRAHKASLVVCFSPCLSKGKIVDDYLISLCEKYGVDIWDMTDIVQDPLLFRNDTHLNDKGADVFTSRIIEKLKSF